MIDTFLPGGEITTPTPKPTKKDQLCAFWRDHEDSRHRLHPTLSLRQYMQRPEIFVVHEFRKVLARHDLPDPEKLEVVFIKLRELYLDPPG